MFSASKTAGPSGYNIANSLRFRSSASAYLNRTPASAGNQKTWTWSAWVKRGALGTNQTIFSGGLISGTYYYTQLYFDTNNALVFYSYPDTADTQATTSAVYRDPSSWYHIVLSVDKTQATNSNGVRIWVNGTQQNLTFASYSQNVNTMINTTSYANWAGKFVTGGAGNYFDGYLAEVNFVDGQALTPSSFGEIDAVTGVWKAKRYAGTYGTNGFYLNFSNGTSTTTLGYDSSGNGNNWTTNNISLTAGSTYDWMIDSPVNSPGSSYGVGNYAVLNPLDKNTNISVSNGNLSLSTSTGGSNQQIRASIALPTSGKWYWETTNSGSTNNFNAGLSQLTASLSVEGVGDLIYNEGGNINNNGVVTSGYSTLSINDVMGLAYDADSNKLYFYKNNSLVNSGGTTPSFSGSYAPMFGVYASGNAQNVNFGQRPFAYTPPSGYKSLCTQNLPAPSIANGANYMAATLYTGNGSSQSIVNTVNGVSFAPDFVWTKARSGTVAAGNHMLGDVVRGTNNTLFSNNTLAAYTDRGVDSFNSNGFTYSTSEQTDGNSAGTYYVAWQWKAGGTAVTNTAGSISSQVSANTTAGFSVVTYTGTGSNATVGHGLGVAPSMVIVKRRDSSSNGDWFTYHISLGNTNAVFLNLTNASSAGGMWNNTTPTSSVISIGTSTGVNASASTYIAYCFAAIPGYSAFGSYTGNGSTDGPFVYCGFRPRYLLIKKTTTGSGNSNWWVMDSSRNLYNVATAGLLPNSSSAENTSLNIVDFLSNGFKMRDANAEVNDSSQPFIYAAFAENPINISLAR